MLIRVVFLMSSKNSTVPQSLYMYSIPDAQPRRILHVCTDRGQPAARAQAKMGGKEAKERRRLKRLAAQQAAAAAEGSGATSTAAADRSPPKSKRNSTSRKSKSKSKKIPKRGEDGYLTPTQLRNARKRRAKQKASAAAAVSQPQSQGGPESGDSNNNKRRRMNDSVTRAVQQQDPSLRFVRNPQGAPIVQAARKYFAEKLGDKKFKVHLSKTEGWRTVSKLAARPDPSNKDKVLIGLFKPQSHQIVSVPDCRAHHPAINAAVQTLTAICNYSDVTPYDDKTGEGYLRYVALSVERSTRKVQLTLVWNSSPPNEDSGKEINEESRQMLDRLIREIREAGGFGGETKKRRRGKKGRDDDTDNDSKKLESTSKKRTRQFGLHSLWVHYNSTWKHSNAIFDISAPQNSWEHVCGPEYLEETLCLEGQEHRIALRFPPNVFRQANIDAFTGIVTAIRRRLRQYNKDRKAMYSDDNDGGCRDISSNSLPSCLELYAGVGTIGLNLVDMVSSLVSSDENPNNAACFRGCVDASIPEESKAKMMYVPKNATDMVRDRRLHTTEVLIVDPPRKGFDDVVLSTLTGIRKGEGPKLVVYVSCGFDAFQRDCDAMLASGRWSLDHAEGHLLFPGSDAIETLAYFVRK